MADKQVPLSIIIRAVDRATAVVRKVNESVNRLSGVTTLRQLGESIKGLAKEAGLGDVAEGFKKVGGAVKDVLSKMLLVGGVVGVGVAALFHMVDEFDKLGDTAEKLGTTADFLAAIRFAAERAGAPIEGVDTALQTLVTNMGAAKAGTGRMLKFLNTISPVLAKQISSAHSLEEALGLLADAEAKLPDAARRAKLAQAALGDPALAPLLARGAAGVQELLAEYAKLAPGQGEAAEAAGKVDDALKNLHAATDGVKAALVTGLSPALQQIVDELRAWFSENRERIAEWAADFGSKLPGRIHKFVDAVLSAIDTATKFIDAIGGIRTVAIAAAAVIVGPLIASIVKLGLVMLANPILAIIGLIAAGVLLIIRYWEPIKDFFSGVFDAIVDAFRSAWPFIKRFLDLTPLGPIIDNWEPLKAFFVDLWDTVMSIFRRAWEYIKGIIDKVVGAVSWVGDKAGWLGRKLGFVPDFQISPTVAPVSQGALSTATTAGAAAGAQAQLSVDFANAPRGTRVAAAAANTTTVDMTVGYNLSGFGGP
jgi:phage-related protein